MPLQIKLDPSGNPMVATDTLPDGEHQVVATLTDDSTITAHAPVSWWTPTPGLTALMVSLVNQALSKGVPK